MDTSLRRSGQTGWIHKLGAVGAILVPVAIMIGFFGSGDSGETAAELIAYAEDSGTELWIQQILALALPFLIGMFVASLLMLLRQANDALRAMMAIGGALFIGFVATGMTLWAAPLLSSDELTTAAAEAYLGYDDVGWVLIGLGGISIALLILGAGLAALELGLIPKWAAWVSVALAIVSLFTVAAIGFFAWAIWLIAAGGFVLFRGDRSTAIAKAPPQPVA